MYGVYSYDPPFNKDELGFRDMDKLIVLRKGDEVNINTIEIHYKGGPY